MYHMAYVSHCVVSKVRWAAGVLLCYLYTVRAMISPHSMPPEVSLKSLR